MTVTIWEKEIQNIDSQEQALNFFNNNVRPIYIGIKNTTSESPTKDYDVPTGAWIGASDTSESKAALVSRFASWYNDGKAFALYLTNPTTCS